MEIKNIAKAFIAAQKEMSNASKDSKNPFFKSQYADLNSVREACLPALNKNGIGVLQPIVQKEGKNFVNTILLHESGETIESFTEILFSKPNDAQAQGSGITYARRYGLQSLVSIGAEDDDGNSASKEQTIKLEMSEDMKETLRVKNESDFSGLKSIVENCGGMEELTEVWTDKANQKIVNALKKYRQDLYTMLVASKDEMKKSFAR